MEQIDFTKPLELKDGTPVELVRSFQEVKSSFRHLVVYPLWEPKK